MYYLRRTAKGLRTTKKLDKEAVELGLEPTFTRLEINGMIEDIAMKLVNLQEHRDKSSE